MRNLLGTTMVVQAIAAAGCSGSGRATEVPDVPTEIVGRVEVPDGLVADSCQVASGTGSGAEVVTVDPDSNPSGPGSPYPHGHGSIRRAQIAVHERGR